MKKAWKAGWKFFMQSTPIVLELGLVDPAVAHIPAHISCVCRMSFLQVGVKGTSDLLRMKSTAEPMFEDCPLFSDSWLSI